MKTTIGSIVVAAEGYYIIYSKNNDKKNITYNIELENIIINKVEKHNLKIQENAINKYGSKFTEEFFYKVISQDKSYLKQYNKLINRFFNNQIKIVIKNRKKDIHTNKWLLNSLYLKI